jgi:ribosomal protein L2
MFNNRRAKRGAELYDFLMSKRFDRATEAECRGIIDSLASGYRESDKYLRAGRKSWLPIEDAKIALTRLPGCEDGR